MDVSIIVFGRHIVGNAFFGSEIVPHFLHRNILRAVFKVRNAFGFSDGIQLRLGSCDVIFHVNNDVISRQFERFVVHVSRPVEVNKAVGVVKNERIFAAVFHFGIEGVL